MKVTVNSSGEEDDDLLSSRSDLLSAMIDRCSDMYSDANSQDEMKDAISKVEGLLLGFQKRLDEIAAAEVDLSNGDKKNDENHENDSSNGGSGEDLPAHALTVNTVATGDDAPVKSYNVSDPTNTATSKAEV